MLRIHAGRIAEIETGGANQRGDKTTHQDNEGEADLSRPRDESAASRQTNR
jgi:hypothetical protein